MSSISPYKTQKWEARATQLRPNQTTPSRLADFRSMVHRNRTLVGYIWFCLELDDYNCTKCAPRNSLTLDELAEAVSISDTDTRPITASF
ncbi:hypothetical protein B0H63DRAFT_470510 [Podospora didyma]|uniref:Uncharacterized protein n=1 Tax=Podospora didyma TaxID=330526 RepID=A0AAE0NTT6_9PEZI|nr:hypothetical protein B0H63DRAFT_470510 [Podospora didyma]